MEEQEKMSKSLEDYFIDWESTAIGFGYGSGEPFTIPALHRFMELCPREGCYRYEVLEECLGGAIFWLLVSVLCKAQILEYGTSPRAAWLTNEGRSLRDFVLSKSPEELVEIVTRFDENYIVCYPDSCNCGPNGYQEGVICANPFWHRR